MILSVRDFRVYVKQDFGCRPGFYQVQGICEDVRNHLHPNLIMIARQTHRQQTKTILVDIRGQEFPRRE